MLNTALRVPFLSVSPFDIPHNIVRKSAFRVLILPISQCDKAYFRVQYGLFWHPIWAISHSDMVHFAMHENTP